MSYAIIGFGKVGQALARAFARNNIEVAVASRRSPQELAPQAQAIGPRVASGDTPFTPSVPRGLATRPAQAIVK
jgi:predicted dinucleotide-binding enzyme